MATIVNTPATTHEHVREEPYSNPAANLLVGILIVLAVLFALFYFGLPMIRSAAQTTAPQINVPDKINVDVNAPQGGNPAP